MREALVVLNMGGDILYAHLPNGRTSVSIPDSRKLWEFIWEWRHQIRQIAHSHPGFGLPHPSKTDLGTFQAIEDGLGKKLYWPIITQNYRATYYRIEGEYVLYKAERLLKDHRFWPYWVKVLHKESYEGKNT